ncbi:MAG: c-type cytochrome [Nitrosomonadales bacterium]|nr:c-type cytochrome [Nitrosomonadales bacterium]
MKKLLSIIIVALFSVQASVVLAEGASKPKVYGKKGYVWDEMTPERTQVLKMGGDPVKGKESFRGCQGCHKADAAGVTEGVYPRLTGQHASVLIKQITEIRAGIRQNPKMLPFVEDPAISVEEIGDIAAYLNTLTTVRENGKGAEDMSAKGKKLYTDNKCSRCHGVNGEGDAAKAYPMLSAQHYDYLIREMKWIRQGVRGNSHPEMVKAISKFSQADFEAVASYLSRLPDYRTVTAAVPAAK